jgi:hypothetical protein
MLQIAKAAVVFYCIIEFLSWIMQSTVELVYHTGCVIWVVKWVKALSTQRMSVASRAKSKQLKRTGKLAIWVSVRISSNTANFNWENDHFRFSLTIL